MAGYDLREGDSVGGAASAWTNLTTVGPETRNAVTVPSWANSIKQINGIMHFDATDADGCITAVRLVGLKYGNYDTYLGGWTAGTAVVNGADASCMRTTFINTNLAVTPGADIWIQSAHVGVATAGSTNVELVFDAAEGEKRYGFIRCGVVAAVGAKALAQVEIATGTATAGGIKIPSDVKRISSMIPVLGGNTIATASGGVANVRLEGALPDGDFGMTCGGHSGLATTAGLCAGYYESEQIRTDVAVSPGGMLNVYTEATGTTWGNSVIGIAIEMAVV